MLLLRAPRIRLTKLQGPDGRTIKDHRQSKGNNFLNYIHYRS